MTDLFTTPLRTAENERASSGGYDPMTEGLLTNVRVKIQIRGTTKGGTYTNQILTNRHAALQATCLGELVPQM